jgi:hypothetical protein
MFVYTCHMVVSPNPTSKFEELVDSTWWDHDDRGEAIVRLCIEEIGVIYMGFARGVEW